MPPTDGSDPVPSFDGAEGVAPTGSEGARSPSGLGRGLAGILEEAPDASTSNADGLLQLLGPSKAQNPRVRQYVAEMALEAIAEAFDATAVVIVRRDDLAEPPTVACRFPPSWSDTSGTKFELMGQLWHLLDGAKLEPGFQRPLGRAEAGSTHGQAGARPGEPGDAAARDGKHHAWFACLDIIGGWLGAAVVRARPLSVTEEAALGQVVRSVAGAIGTATPDPATPVGITVISDGATPAGAPDATVTRPATGQAQTTGPTRTATGQAPATGPTPPGTGRAPATGPTTPAVATGEGPGDRRGPPPDVVVEIVLGGGASPRRAVGRGPTMEWAVARAAAELSGTGADVTFSGRAEVEGTPVSIVVLVAADGSPAIGLTVAEQQPGTGPAEAVFSAVGRRPRTG